MSYKGYTANPKRPTTRLKDTGELVSVELLVATATDKVMKEKNDEGKMVDVKPNFTKEKAVKTLDHIIDVKSSLLVKKGK